jgi:exopolysaccharide biosynthesis protein/F0F1-type ATP synthase assembly protein I
MKEPYIKENAIDEIEDTNSIILTDEMKKDESRYVDTKVEPIKNTSFVEIQEEIKEEKKEEIKKHTISKKDKLFSNLMIISLLLLPALIVLVTIGFHSRELISQPVLIILILLLGITLLVLTYTMTFKNKVKVKKKVFKIIYSIFMSFYIIGVAAFLFILYGPMNSFKDWLIPTAMTTMNHQYLATWFYSPNEVNEVLNNNKIVESEEDTDLNLITVGNIDFSSTAYENEYEKQVLTKDEDNDVYKIINIEGKGYKGYLVVVYDPSRVTVAYTKYLNVRGEYVTDMAAANDALLAINGGGFVDPNYSSNGGIPQGTVIKDGKIISSRSYTKSGGIIGMTYDNKLILGKMTATEAIKKGVRDAVSFGPFLIVNGERAFISGNGGWGTAPRTAIGQRKDGIILLLVIDGRTLKYPGADMSDLTDIMENYGAYNAANLDGGTSSVLVFPENVSKNYLTTSELKTHCRNSYCYINDPIDGGGSHETRWVATSIIVK